jgi:coenzyme F420 hydrogenase subunit beta
MKYFSSKNISYVVEKKLCFSCGACATVCSNKSIIFEETQAGYLYPKINELTCIQCSVCLNVCSGAQYIDEIQKEYLDESSSIKYIAAYIGKTKDKKILNNAQSGGVVTGLINELLEKGEIDAALCTYMTYSYPPRARAILVTSSKDLYITQKSKYVQVALLENLLEYLRDHERIAVVGLPCHMHGLSKIIQLFPEINKKIALKIGLICDCAQTSVVIDYLSQKATRKKVSYLVFRDKSRTGYPGKITVEACDGKLIVLSEKIRIKIKDYFTPVRCRLCLDKLNVFADIVCGDPHGISNYDKKNGETLVLIKNETGNNAICKAKENLLISKVNVEDAINGQKIKEKISNWRKYIKAWNYIGMTLPRGINQDLSIKLKGEDIYIKKINYSLSVDKYKTNQDLFKFINKKIMLGDLCWIIRYLKNKTLNIR